MLSVFRFFEVLLFSLVNFGPFVYLSVKTFHNRMRFSKLVTFIACIVLIVIQFLTRYWSAVHNVGMNVTMSLLRLSIFLVIYVLLFDIHWGKVLFVELIFANVGNFILLAGVCIERNLFPAIEHRIYCWHTSLMMVLLHMLITLPYSFTLKRYFRPMIAASSKYKRWNYYWLIPFVFYFVMQYTVHGGPVKGLDIILNPHTIISLFLINVGSYLVYQIIIQLDSQLIQNLELEKEKHYRDIELLEYQILEERITDARRARHDLRHHMIVIEDYLNTKDYDILNAYVQQLVKASTDSDVLQYCSHRTINTILMYYGRIASGQEIDFSVNVSVSNRSDIATSDISVLLSNLLENSIQACLEVQNQPKQIIVNGSETPHSLCFTIDNTCTNEIRKNKQGKFLSTKKEGSGLGIESAKHIVQRYNGVFTAEKKEDMFYVSFLLNL